MRIIKWVLFNAVFAGLIYYGIIEKVEGAENIIIFCAWAMGIISLFLMSDSAVETFVKKGFSVPRYVDAAFDLSVTGVFVWHGYFWTAGIYFIHILMDAGLRKAVEEKLENQEK